MDACTVMKREKRHNASGISNEGMQFLAMNLPFQSVRKEITENSKGPLGQVGVLDTHDCITIRHFATCF